MENKIILGAGIAFLIVLTGAVYYPTVIDAVVAINNRQTAPTITYNNLAIEDDYLDINTAGGIENRTICYNFDIIINDPSDIFNGMNKEEIKEEYGNLNDEECNSAYDFSPISYTDAEIKAELERDADYRIKSIQEYIHSELKITSEFDEDIRVRPENNLIGWAYNPKTKEWENN